MEFARWVGGRLPTEVEFEYAARRQGQDILYPWGNNSPDCNRASYDWCDNGTAPVCSHYMGDTSQGLCDMGGNLWELMQDEWHRDYNGAPNTGLGWCAGSCPRYAGDVNYNPNNTILRSVRGGDWQSIPDMISTTTRNNFEPENQYYGVGGRLVKR